MKRTSWSSGLAVSGDGSGVVAHAGSVAVRLLADRVGLTETLSTALARRGFVPGHDRGRVLVDVATMLVAGGEAISDIDTLRHQDQVLGPVASPATVWRALDELADTSAKRVAAARAKTRKRVWELLPGGLPAARVADSTLPKDLVVLDVDATIVIAHSELSEAIAHPPAPQSLLFRVDGAGLPQLLDWIAGCTAKTSGRQGRSVSTASGSRSPRYPQAITRVPKRAWTPAMDTDGDVREHADIVEITGLLPKEMTEKWPTGMRGDRPP